MEIRKFNGENLVDWCIVNDWRGTRNGFRHNSTILHYNNEFATAGVSYLNRTWESYTYQTSMYAVVSKAQEERRKHIIDLYKYENNIQKITNKHKQAVENAVAGDKLMLEVAEIRQQLASSR